jgi:hypothetical protein
VSDHFFSEGATMNGKWLAGVALGVVLGLVVSSWGWPSRAEGQAAQVRGPDPHRPQWEYKVVATTTHGGDPNAMTTGYNGLAKDGWEYVGPVGADQRGGTVHGVFVLFKRSK